MQYLEERDLDEIVTIIGSYQYSGEPAPDYDNEVDGIDAILSLFERIKQDYYPTVFDKAAHLFVALNKGHYFSNGNKRIALISCLQLLHKNGYQPRRKRKEAYRQLVHVSYPESVEILKDETPHGFSTAYEYAFYLLALEPV